jgi:uncharacterized Zn finger protein (UPF0148 family)
MMAQMTLTTCEECGAVLWEQSAKQGRCCECGAKIEEDKKALFLLISRDCKSYPEILKQ